MKMQVIIYYTCILESEEKEKGFEKPFNETVVESSYILKKQEYSDTGRSMHPNQTQPKKKQKCFHRVYS